jgi:hypothetical protein
MDEMTEKYEEEKAANIILTIWYDGKRLNEVLFCAEFLKEHPWCASAAASSR